MMPEVEEMLQEENRVRFWAEALGNEGMPLRFDLILTLLTSIY